MSKHERIARIESVDAEGVFRASLATEGEASDGDILSIAGGQIPKRMPMLISHWNDPTAVAGSITEPTKDLKSAPPTLRITGNIEMGGVGALADIRRDVAFMMNKHGGAMSIRWDAVEGGKQPIRRVNLPSDHAYYVDAETATGAKRWGSFWPEWRGVEGSIVALGADPAATVDGRICATRAAETEGEVSAFWRTMAEAAAADAETETESEPDADEGKVAASIAALRVQSNECIEVGASLADLINAVASNSGAHAEELQQCRIGDYTIVLPSSVADQLEGERAARELERDCAEPVPEPDPEPEIEVSEDQRASLELDISEIKDSSDATALIELVEEALDGYDARMNRHVKELLAHVQGKVNP